MDRINGGSIDLANRVLAWHEYGDPAGAPVLYFHSYPGSGLEAAYLDEAARQRGLHIVAPDRPGYGDSSMSPNRRLVDWPRDVTMLANHLGLDRFAIVGLNAGAVHAFACGTQLSRRISTIAAVSTLVPARSHLVATAKAFTKLATLPAKGRAFHHPERAERAWDTLFADGTEREKAVRTDARFRAAWLPALDHAFIEGSGGAAKDYALATGANWGFAMGNVSVDRVLAWHGDADVRTPVAEVRRFLERLPHCELTVVPEAGRYSLWLDHHTDVLDALRG